MGCCSCKHKAEGLRSFQLQDYWIESISSKITDAENQLRHQILQQILAGQTVAETPAIQKLADQNILFCEEQRVKAIYPVSAVETDKQVQLKGLEGYAMCALDAIGFAYTFGTTVEVHTRLWDTQEELVLRVSPGKLEIVRGPSFYVLYPDLRNCNHWSSHCCLHMHYFSSVEAMKAYIDEQDIGDADIIALDPEQALTMSSWIFGEKEEHLIKA